MIIGRTVSITINDTEYTAKVDTGSFSTSIDEGIAEALGLEKTGKFKSIKTALGEDYREIVKCKFVIGDKEIETEATITDRSALRHPILIGRKDLAKMGAIIDVTKKGVI